jgi:outer membrane protein TolC
MEYMPSGMGNNMFMVMGTVTLPIYRKKYKSMETEAIYWRESAIKQKEDLQNSLVTEFESAIALLKDSQRKLDLLEEQIELTEQTMELSVTSYATDGSSFEEILSIQRELLDFRLQQLNTQIEQQLNYAKLEVLSGY